MCVERKNQGGDKDKDVEEEAEREGGDGEEENYTAKTLRDVLIDIHPDLDPLQFNVVRRGLNKYKSFKKAIIPLLITMWEAPAIIWTDFFNFIVGIFTPNLTYEYRLLARALNQTHKEIAELGEKRNDNYDKMNKDFGRNNVYSSSRGVCYKNIIKSGQEWEVCTMGQVKRGGKVMGDFMKWEEGGREYKISRATDCEQDDG